MTNLFHGAATAAAPIADRILELVRNAGVVQADETSIKAQREEKRAFIWTFLAQQDDTSLIAYRYSKDRSGSTPSDVLGGTTGTLVVDGYTGYNAVTKVDGRTRAGCLAHVRRKFFEALGTAAIAKEALEHILGVYRVEHDAAQARISRTAAHRELRQSRSRPAMERFHAWLTEQRDQHPPKSPIGVAISYTLNSWDALTTFLDDENVPVDNNASERALRGIALGRKNYLFVGHHEAGERIASLYTLVATCEANSVNPIAYLTDVLPRVNSHPARQIDELLPHNWKPAA